MDRSIWDCLEKSSAEGLLLTTCGTELQELMRQIDIMVRNKRMEWESELLSTQDSLSLREQELNHARLLLDQKHQEVGMLKHQLETYESNQTGVITQYEAQLKSLQTQLNDLKKKHEEMSQRRTKKSRHFADKEKELRSEVENLTMEVKEKRLLIAKHDKESSEWEISKRSLKHQLECLEKHKKTLTTNYERCQQQLSVTQERLQRSNSMVEEVEGTSQSLLRKLEEELSNDKELIQRQERVMCDLQDKIQQLESARHQANNDKYKYREQADKANCKLKVVEEEAARLQSALSARDAALRGSEREIVELKDELISTRSQLDAKDKLLSVMQQHSPATRRGVDAHELERKVALLEASVATMTETEGSLRAEVTTLEQQLAAARSEAGTLNDIVHNTEVAKVNTLNEEIRSLQNKLEDMEASHTSQLCGMKADVTNLAAHLHGRDANIVRLSELCSDMERKLRDEAGRRDKLDHELATATSRLHQLQASTAPRGARDQLAPTRTSSTEKSLCEAEKQLEELQRGYGRAVSRLEEENQHLKGEVSGLKSELIMKDRMSKRESREEEEEDMKRKYEERIARLEQRILDVTGAGDDVIESNPSVVVRSDLPSDDEQRTPTPTRDFLLSIGIDPNASSVAPSSGESTLDERQLQAMILAVDEGFADSGAPSVDEYVADEERRVVELEGRIERHIDDMKHAMQVAMEKYLVPTPAQ